MSTPQPLLKAEDLSKRYEDGVLALDHLNLEVRSGVVAGREIGFKSGPGSGDRDVEGGFFLTIGAGGTF